MSDPNKADVPRRMQGFELTTAPTTDPTSIYRIRDGMYAADLMTAALAWLDFFSWLAERPADKATICRSLGIHERGADVLLTLCRAQGLVTVRDGAFELTDLAREHLVAGSPWFIGPYYAALKERPVCRDFVEVLRTDRVPPWAGLPGRDDWHRSMHDPAFAAEFTAAMDCRGVHLGQALARSLDLHDQHHVLDVAGGSGIYACALIAAHPHLTATVLEQVPVDRVAAAAIAQRGCSAAIDVHSQDMFAADWPVHADVHLFSNVLHDWGRDTVAKLLTRSFAALPPGGLVIVHDAFVNAAKDGPLPVAEYSALLLHATEGKCYSVGEYHELLAAAGFEVGDCRTTAADRGRMLARKPR